MGKTTLTTADFRNFLAGYGITRPIDLSKVAEPGWSLREEMEELAPQLVQVPAKEVDSYIRLDQLKKVKGASARVFNAMANHDGENDLSLYELALGLEKAELLRLPLGKSTATLWQSTDSIRWGILKHERQSELVHYLEIRRDDDGRKNALDILEALAQQNPADFEGTIALDPRFREIMLSSNDPEIRRRFLKLFQIPSVANGRDILEGFENLEREFEPILSKLKTQDLSTAQELYRSSDPKKAAFGLLCAKKLLNKSQFKAVCRTLEADRPSLSSKTAYSYGTNPSVAVTVGELLQTLMEGRSDLPTTLAGLDL